MRDTHIADRLRNAGLNVIEVDGWHERGSDTFNPKGSVDHHTAGAAHGNAPSLAVCINGRADLPGPLCNVLVARNDDCYIIAAGRANHAGKGDWAGLTGNSAVYGVERENVGTTAEPWRSDQTDVAARVHAALIRGTGHPDPALCCEHKEWAPHRKTDAHTITGNDLRARIGNALHFPQPHPQPQEDDMALRIVQCREHPTTGEFVTDCVTQIRTLTPQALEHGRNLGLYPKDTLKVPHDWIVWVDQNQDGHNNPDNV